MNPLPLARSLDEPRLAQDLQMPRYARFTLGQHLRKVGDAQGGIGAQPQEPQAAGFTGGTQPPQQDRMGYAIP